MLNRRKMLHTTAGALALSTFPMGFVPAADGKAKKLLFFTRSAGFQHSVVNRNEAGKGGRLGKAGEIAHAEQIVTDLGAKHGFEVTATKDGRVFVPEELAKYDAIFFYTTGNLEGERAQDGSPPMPRGGKQALIDFVAQGKGFLGSHCASDTFHSPDSGSYTNAPAEKVDPYIKLLGGEFIVHGAQLKAKMVVTDPKFPGLADVKDFELMEEWYALKNFAKDLHVILAQDSTAAMEKLDERGKKGNQMYNRPLYPATWARAHEKGRVFYTSMGHREDVWTNPLFQQILLGGIAWALGNVQADVTPNIDQVTPKAGELKTA